MKNKQSTNEIIQNLQAIIEDKKNDFYYGYITGVVFMAVIWVLTHFVNFYN